jgi:hypothetical protein
MLIEQKIHLIKKLLVKNKIFFIVEYTEWYSNSLTIYNTSNNIIKFLQSTNKNTYEMRHLPICVEKHSYIEYDDEFEKMVDYIKDLKSDKNFIVFYLKNKEELKILL